MNNAVWVEVQVREQCRNFILRDIGQLRKDFKGIF